MYEVCVGGSMILRHRELTHPYRHLNLELLIAVGLGTCASRVVREFYVAVVLARAGRLRVIVDAVSVRRRIAC